VNDGFNSLKEGIAGQGARDHIGAARDQKNADVTSNEEAILLKKYLDRIK
jgi:hypothetical protein